MPKSPAERTDPHYLLLGRVLRPHGVRGELRIQIQTDYPERIPRLKKVYLGKGPDKKVKAFTVEGMRMHQSYGLLKLKEISDRNDAERLRNLYVMVAIEDAVPLEDGEYYLYQLIGLTVTTDNGQTLGTLDEIIETGANDVYVVNGEAFGEVLVPATDETILDIDLDDEVMVVKLPEGLLPDA